MRPITNVPAAALDAIAESDVHSDDSMPLPCTRSRADTIDVPLLEPTTVTELDPVAATFASTAPLAAGESTVNTPSNVARTTFAVAATLWPYLTPDATRPSSDVSAAQRVLSNVVPPMRAIHVVFGPRPAATTVTLVLPVA
jgi:hypothetical protein